MFRSNSITIYCMNALLILTLASSASAFFGLDLFGTSSTNDDAKKEVTHDAGSQSMEAAEPQEPLILSLQRESVPVKRQGKVVSFKTSYSGTIRVGTPTTQEFRVVFDTGSGHIILPSVQCESETCMKHNRYNGSSSTSSVAINVDGTPVPRDELGDQATIGFGTGQVTGEFVRDVVCLGPADTTEGAASAPCLNMQIVQGVDMTPQPFKSFVFDGIIGLGLSSLALSEDFSFLGMMSRSKYNAESHFAVFLTEGEEGEESEIAFGGHNKKRLLDSSLHWTPVTKSELGYWLVEIVAVRIDGKTLDVCEDGTCRGVMDTGTSHLGLPTPFGSSITEQLTTLADGISDCRDAKGSTLEIEIPGFNITLTPENYMRKLPLEEGVNVGSATGVTLDSNQAIASTTTTTVAPEVGDLVQQVPSWCRPRFMPVSLPEPIGPKLFILGEPVLHKYYSVYDWKEKRIGMGLAASKRNMMALGHSDSSLAGEDGDVSSMLQQTVVIMKRKKKSSANSVKKVDQPSLDESLELGDEDESYLVQVTVTTLTTLETFEDC